MQEDGNFVLYKSLPWIPANAILTTGTDGKGTAPYHIKMQNDGNLVLYDFNMTPLWASHTMNKGTAPNALILQEDRNLVIYDKDRQATWATGTSI